MAGSVLQRARLDRARTIRALTAEVERREAIRLRNLDVFGILGYEPNCLVRHAYRQAGIPENYLPPPCGQCPQEKFHRATEFDVLYGGAAGGGKTRALLMEGVKACVRWPGIRVGAFRRTFGELEESLLAELGEISYAKDLGARWVGGKYNLIFPNGSRMMFRYAETVADATRRQGGQYQLLLFDERNLTLPDVCSFLESRLRSGKASVPVLGIRSGTNPGGIGHGASKTRYVDATDRGDKVHVDERGRTVRFIPSKLSDNPHVNPEYSRDLDNMPEKMRAAFRDGNWDVFAGQMFSEWVHDRHVCKPITLPPSWRRYNGVDWGYTAPWCVLWVAVDEDKRAWVYREVYRTQVGEADQAKAILEAEADDEVVLQRFADDAMWAVRGDAKPIAEVYAENGVVLTEAGKGGRIPGWQRIHSLLADGPACPMHRALGWETCPMVHVFSTCTELIRELPNLPHATKGNPEDADTDASDHAADAFRYFAINVGGGAQFDLFDDDDTKRLDGLPEQLPTPLAGGRVALIHTGAEDVSGWGDFDDDQPKRGGTVTWGE